LVSNERSEDRNVEQSLEIQGDSQKEVRNEDIVVLEGLGRVEETGNVDNEEEHVDDLDREIAELQGEDLNKSNDNNLEELDNGETDVVDDPEKKMASRNEKKMASREDLGTDWLIDLFLSKDSEDRRRLAYKNGMTLDRFAETCFGFEKIAGGSECTICSWIGPQVMFRMNGNVFCKNCMSWKIELKSIERKEKKKLEIIEDPKVDEGTCNVDGIELDETTEIDSKTVPAPEKIWLEWSQS